jgi:hypothetical protein
MRTIPVGNGTEHSIEYRIGRYRVVERIEQVKEGHRWRVTAYDDEATREMPWPRRPIIRFDLRGTTLTLDAAHQSLAAGVALMKRSIADDMP